MMLHQQHINNRSQAAALTITTLRYRLSFYLLN